jgi:hypothetical protein
MYCGSEYRSAFTHLYDPAAHTFSRRPKGRLKNATLEVRGFFRDFVESPRYRENLKKRVLGARPTTWKSSVITMPSVSPSSPTKSRGLCHPVRR